MFEIYFKNYYDSCLAFSSYFTQLKWWTSRNLIWLGSILNHALLEGSKLGILVESSERTLREGNGKPLQYSCLENPKDSMKRQKYMMLKDELPRSVGTQYTTGEQWTNNSRKMKGWSQSKNNTQVWMWLVMEVKSNCCKKPYCIGTGMLGPWIKINWKWSNRKWQEWTLTFSETVN